MEKIPLPPKTITGPSTYGS